MTKSVFPSPDWPALPILAEDTTFPVHRIFCVGRNYAAHAAEMGAEVDREAPFYFTKSALAVAESGATVPYPPGTDNYHHEVELFVAIGAPAFRVEKDKALAAVYGYGVGFDMTRRDLQNQSKAKSRPWDTAKDVEGSAILGPVTPAAAFAPDGQAITLTVNGETRQSSTIAKMVWSVADLLADLSRLYHLRPGDIIMTGTPEGVGPVKPGDVLVGQVEGLAPCTLTIGEPE